MDEFGKTGQCRMAWVLMYWLYTLLTLWKEDTFLSSGNIQRSLLSLNSQQVALDDKEIRSIMMLSHHSYR